MSTRAAGAPRGLPPVFWPTSAAPPWRSPARWPAATPAPSSTCSTGSARPCARSSRTDEESRWIARYGFVEHTVRRPADEALEDGRHSRRRRYRTVIRERPGLAPAALFHLIGHTVFLRLADVASGLPPYTEQVRLVDLDDAVDG